MTAFYNECDPVAAQWLRNLISAGHIAPGTVDERPIQAIEAFELSGFTQCHFFAGIGVWSYALRQAGWSDDRPIWTGSCPCQPFSNAGLKKGISDERHLWPYWHPLIEQRKPTVVVGEQVASKDGLGWLDLVSVDMETSNYAFGSADLCAAGVGGAHIRQRLYFVGVAESESIGGRAGLCDFGPGKKRVAFDCDGGTIRGMGFSDGAGSQPRGGGSTTNRHGNSNEPTGGASRMGNTDTPRTEIGLPKPPQRQEGYAEIHDHGSDRLFRPDARGYGIIGLEGRSRAPMLGRNAADWLFCRDGKWRAVEPGTFPLAHAAPARVGRLRAYGNALDAETATEFCRTVKEICDGV